MKVLKFGGTSVGSAERIRAVKDLITKDKERKIVVISAMSGSTNSLVEISKALFEKNVEKAKQIIGELRQKYDLTWEELFPDKTSLSAIKAYETIKYHFSFLNHIPQYEHNIIKERHILARGEMITAALLFYHLEDTGFESALLNALRFMKLDENGEADQAFIMLNIQKEIADYPACDLFITQGYICADHTGEISNLQRGGSDYSASLMGAALDASEIQIWTDIDGMHNNDPRIVNRTRPIAELSFDEAAELAYFGAKILHPLTVLPAKLKNIPVKLLNTMQPDQAGTVITYKTIEKAVKAIAAKDNIIAIKIKSARMLLAYGFLKKIFEVFEKYKKPVDMVTTSEVGVSVTIDNDIDLDKIVSEISEFGNVEVDKNMTIVCIVGDLMGDTVGYARKIFSSFETIPIRMISYGGSRNNVSLLVKSEHKNEVLNTLNETLFDW